MLGPGANVQPPEARISRGLEVHPEGGGVDLDVWIDRSLVTKGYAWSVPAAGEQRVGVGSYEPRDHVKEPTREIATRLGVPPVRYQGNWFPHELRPATEDGVFFVGDSAGHCFPLSGEGIRTAFYFGIACGRELRATLAGDQTREQALAAYGAFSRRHARAYTWALALQRADPRAAPAAARAPAGAGRPPPHLPARVLVVPAPGGPRLRVSGALTLPLTGVGEVIRDLANHHEESPSMRTSFVKRALCIGLGVAAAATAASPAMAASPFLRDTSSARPARSSSAAARRSSARARPTSRRSCRSRRPARSAAARSRCG